MKRLLIAEDNDSNYILMTYILKNHYEFERACNGKEAVDVMDGLEATMLIKEHCPGLPVIALTANAFESDRQLAMDAGCVDFLTKPISSQLCLSTIAKYIGE